ncbi:hypothetical protein ACHAWU_009843 [Discostella pseudostelligera]|uniref:Uncharacterized protein n=1 Tax=Discostella pseudostelligera TaxID=259834 RepID=A0ABD3M146_9STRA
MRVGRSRTRGKDHALQVKDFGIANAARRPPPARSQSQNQNKILSISNSRWLPSSLDLLPISFLCLASAFCLCFSFSASPLSPLSTLAFLSR